MTKDELIADLRGQVMTLSRLLELALEKQPPVVNRSPGAIRQERYRAKQEASQSVTERHSVTEDQRHGTSLKASQSVTGGTIGGSTSVLLGEDVSSTSQENDGEELTGVLRGESVTEVTDSDASDADWDSFRDVFPKTDRTSWPKAKTTWRRLPKIEQAAALVGAQKYAAKNPAPEYRKGAQSWLLEHRWETVDDTPAYSGNGHRPKNEPDYSGIDAFTEQLTRMGVE